MAIKDIKWYWQ